jgi:hypothetical protein
MAGLGADRQVRAVSRPCGFLIRWVPGGPMSYYNQCSGHRPEKRVFGSYFFLRTSTNSWTESALFFSMACSSEVSFSS